MSEFSGLVREIRASTSSEQFDLAGYSESRAKDLIQNAFGTPLTDATSMIRCTLVVGGGKLVRSRYDDDLIKWVTSALKDLGFVEDKSAAETLDSQGTFKTQHDTGQNLKYVIVFPRLSIEVENESAVNSVDTSSPEYIVSVCEFSTFKEIVSSKTPSWRQKKKLLKVIQDLAENFQLIENKLVNGSALTESEQTLYDTNPGNHSEKISWLQSEIKAMVDNGQLTATEKQELLASISNNIQSLSNEKKDATGSKVHALETKIQTLQLKKEAIEKLIPIKHRLKYGLDILKLRVRLMPLLALEDKGRSVSLTLADLKLLEEKSDIECQISRLENSSRGWYEDEIAFKEMCEQEVSEAKIIVAKQKNQQGTKIVSSSVKSAPKSFNSGWSTIGSSGKKVTGTTSTVKKSSGFAAAFDDDSD